MKKTILILSGCKASGKTHMLNKSFAENIPLFGNSNQTIFSEYCEFMASKYKFPNRDILNFLTLGFIIRNNIHKTNTNMVVHLDLYNFYFKYMHPNKEDISKIELDNYLNNETKNDVTRQKQFKEFFTNIFDYENNNIVVSTLFTGYEKNLELHFKRWNKYNKDKYPVYKFIKRSKIPKFLNS